MSLSEIGAAMSRPLVGIDEEPSELERVCLRVREVCAAIACSSLMTRSIDRAADGPLVLQTDARA